MLRPPKPPSLTNAETAKGIGVRGGRKEGSEGARGGRGGGHRSRKGGVTEKVVVPGVMEEVVVAVVCACVGWGWGGGGGLSGPS